MIVLYHTGLRLQKKKMSNKKKQHRTGVRPMINARGEGVAAASKRKCVVLEILPPVEGEGGWASGNGGGAQLTT